MKKLIMVINILLTLFLIGCEKNNCVGEKKDGVTYGHGTLTTKKETYVSEWRKGLAHGQGRMTKLDGRKSKGEWKNGKLWNGTIYSNDGSIV